MKKLKVTKQSLNRVVKDLINLDAIEFKKDEMHAIEAVSNAKLILIKA